MNKIRLAALMPLILIAGTSCTEEEAAQFFLTAIGALLAAALGITGASGLCPGGQSFCQ